LISRRDSAAMVPNTSDDFPDPETPVNTVSRRLGMSREMSARLFSLAPRTWITSWLSAAGRASWWLMSILVEPSMSVNISVTVPVAARPRSPLSQPGPDYPPYP
jgi:hypothetical protein